MSRYTDATVIDLQAAYVVAATEAELERNVQAALDAITLTRVVTAILLGGPGSGGSLSVMIEHGSAGSGFVPDAIEARFYLAEIPAEIANRRAGAAARATAGLSLKDSVLTGTSAGGLTGGMLLFGTASAERNTYLAQTDWYINESTGDDSNSGATSGTALATSAELVRRFGTDPLIDDVTINVWLESDITAVFEMSARFQGDDAAIWIHGGVAAILATDVVTAWTSLTPGSEPAITGTTIADFSIYAGYRLTWLDGPMVGNSVFLGAQAESGAVGSEIWRHGAMSYYSAAGFSAVTPSAFGANDNSPNIGNSFQIERLYVLEGAVLQAKRIDTGTAAGGSANMAGFILSDLSINAAVTGRTLIDLRALNLHSAGGGQATLFNCIVDSENITGTGINLFNCAGGTQAGFLGSVSFASMESLRVFGLSCSALTITTCNIRATSLLLVDGTSARITLEQGARTMTDNQFMAGVWTTTDVSSIIRVDETCIMHPRDVWGASTGTALGWDIDGRVYVQAVADISTFVVTGNDSEIGGAVTAYGAMPAVTAANNAMVAISP